MNCICCGKELSTDHDAGEEHESIVNRFCWNNGSVDYIYCGYGSRYDGSAFIFGICDDCIQERVEHGEILYHKEFIFDLKTDDQERWLEIKKNKLDGN